MAENFSIDLNNKSFLISEEKKPIPEIQKSADEEKYFAQLRDCFNAGYQFPQYCIDNNIKKPLFVGVDESQKTFLWEICTQFRYRNIFFPVQYAFYSTDSIVNYSHHDIINLMTIQNFSKLDISNFDKIIVLSTEKLDLQNDKLIYLNEVVNDFIIRTYCDMPLLNFAQKHPKVRIVLTNFPTPNRKFNDSLLWYMSFRQKIMTSTPENKFSNLFDKFGYSTEEIIKITANVKITRSADGEVHMRDDDHPLIKIKNGRRETAFQPENYKNTIYFLGTCHQYGLDAPYDKTIESHLQKMLNEKNLPYRVENCAQTIIFRYQDIFYILNKLNPQPGDIIFVYLTNIKSKTFKFCDVSRAFDSYDYRELYPYKNHVNEIGYKILAEKYFEYLTKNNFFQDVEFNYPLPHCLLIVMVFQKKIFQVQQIFCKIRSLKSTKINFAKKEYQSAA